MTTVFVDVDTQFDFMVPSGALYVPGAESIAGAVARLNRWAAANGTVVLSTTDAHAENDPEFTNWPAHCVTGTLGQRKPSPTLLDRRVVVPSTPGDYEISGAQQIIVEKQHLDCFTNPNLPSILECLRADRYVVYGVVMEYCVKCAAMGLLQTGKRVELVQDVVMSLNEDDSARTMDEFLKAGGAVTNLDKILAA